MKMICAEGDSVGFGYINSETRQLVIDKDISQATKFASDYNDELVFWLGRFRKSFPDKLFSSIEVPDKIFDKPLRNVWAIPLTYEERLEIL